MAEPIFLPPPGVTIKHRGNGEYAAVANGYTIAKIRVAAMGLGKYCDAIWVHRKFRRLGLAKALMAHVESATGRALERPPQKYVNRAIRALGDSFRAKRETPR